MGDEDKVTRDYEEFECPGVEECHEERFPDPPTNLFPYCACGQNELGFKVHTRDCLNYTEDPVRDSAQDKPPSASRGVVFQSDELYPRPDATEEEKTEWEEIMSLQSEVAKLGLCVCGQPTSACVCRPARYTTQHPDLCLCCKYPTYKCQCNADREEALRRWRAGDDTHNIEAVPPVLEPSHPLMEKFQVALRRYLERENKIAEEQILELTDDLRLQKQKYKKDLEEIYRHDHDTNQQRIIIGEYEAELAKLNKEREEQEAISQEVAAKYKEVKEKLNEEIIREREAMEEVEALSSLVKQLEQWKQETESELLVSQRMSEKMRQERREKADEKRQLDIIIYQLTNEKWKLESETKLFEQQIAIKSEEAEAVSDRIATYSAELEDLAAEQRRLVSLWNSVLVNIGQRDKIYQTVRGDYDQLHENYRTMHTMMEVIKKSTSEEMSKNQELLMRIDKFNYEIDISAKALEKSEDQNRKYEEQIKELEEMEAMTQKDIEMVEAENKQLEKTLRDARREYEKKVQEKLALDNEVLQMLQDCVLNDKASQAMAQAIRTTREKCTKEELNLIEMENSYAKLLLDIELAKEREKELELKHSEKQKMLDEKERENKELHEQIAENDMKITRKQSELDVVQKKLLELVEKNSNMSPVERQIEELELQIGELRERTGQLQQEWLRQQGHVVRLTHQHVRQSKEIALAQKQSELCSHALARLEGERASVETARAEVERALRGLRGRLEQLERARKEHADSNKDTLLANVALTHEYTAKLKDLEMKLIETEEDICNLENEKSSLSSELDKIIKESMVWQRKGILAVDLKRNMTAAKSAEGEIFKMKTEIHKMQVRRDQLKRMSEKLSSDLAMCVTRRETVCDKIRAAEALNKPDVTTKSAYVHKLRLAKSHVKTVNTDIKVIQDELHLLVTEEKRLLEEIRKSTEENKRLEESIAELQEETEKNELEHNWLVERTVRSQRLTKDLKEVANRQSVKLRRPEAAITSDYERSGAACAALADIADELAGQFPQARRALRAAAYALRVADEPTPDTPSEPRTPPCPCAAPSTDSVQSGESDRRRDNVAKQALREKM